MAATLAGYRCAMRRIAPGDFLWSAVHGGNHSVAAPVLYADNSPLSKELN